MANYIYGAIALTGAAGSGSLDDIDGTALADKDVAFVAVQGGGVYHYILDDDSGASESLPNIVQPNANGGNKRWILHAQFQIQVISASVGSNALTISTGVLVLDFRSTTLGSGTITTVAGTPSNLVISSGSTLGTVSGQQSRIVVLALNNAGTLELAAVNIQGGNDLTETGLISTTAEGGAGGADSANVVYSTTARSNLAYRVLGYIESTQATAGTWATSPSTIQGCGGQALTSMSSLGHSQTWQDVVGSRADNVTYYNTTGRPIMVSVSVFDAAHISGATQFYVDGVIVAENGPTAGSAGGAYVGITAIVPPNSSYKADLIHYGALDKWFELK